MRLFVAHAGRDYAVKRLESAVRSLDYRIRQDQVFFKRNHPEIPHANYDNASARESAGECAAFLPANFDRLTSIARVCLGPASLTGAENVRITPGGWVRCVRLRGTLNTRLVIQGSGGGHQTALRFNDCIGFFAFSPLSSPESSFMA